METNELQMKKYQLTEIMLTFIDQEEYDKWLINKAKTHLKRDKKRGNTKSTLESYKVAIHKAVCESHGKDAYTGEVLKWSLLNQYSNEKSQKGGRNYKRKFAMLPTVDHVGNGKGDAHFKICSWETNDAKNDLSYDDFLKLCHKVVAFSKSDDE